MPPTAVALGFTLWQLLDTPRAHKHFAARERAAILLASNVGNSVPQIAAMWMTDDHHVRRVIHYFNQRGMASLDPEYRGGRPRRITDADRR